MRALTPPLLVALIVATASPAFAQTGTSLTIPAFAGYAHPDANAMRRDRKTGSVLSCAGELVFYFTLTKSGPLNVDLELLTEFPRQRVRMRLDPAKAKRSNRSPNNKPNGTKAKGNPTSQSKADASHTWFDEVPIDPTGTAISAFRGMVASAPGIWRLTLKTADGSPLKNLAALHLTGAAAHGATASTVERRNASSVHLWYAVPKAHRDNIEWFYCELTPKTDPLWTYYMATGWHRGYFGMQVNSKTERRVIFSVWDSGSEAIDRKKVQAEDLVQLIAKGEHVHASGFGNEGTGGHSHLVHDWQLGDTIRFLVRAQPDGPHTTYTGWFSHRTDDTRTDAPNNWQLLASFKAPRDGKYLHGLYSFSENFSGSNGDRDRQCDYGNVWLRTKDGEWLAVRSAKFTHDGHGNKHRLDHRGGVRDGRFFLQHGDFVTPSMRRGTALTLPDEQGKPGKPPSQLPH